jgi:hypothetical protein
MSRVILFIIFLQAAYAANHARWSITFGGAFCVGSTQNEKIFLAG